MARSRRSGWLFYVILGLIVCALPVGYFLLLDREEAISPPPMKADEPKVQELHIGELSGTVQIRRPGSAWTTADKGTVLKPSDAVRTTDGSIAVLVSGEQYEVKMEPGTEVSVDQLTDSISRILLQSGMASAKVKGKGRHTFEVKAAGSDATARTQDGSFAISNNGQGTVAVGTQEGEVQFLGSGKVVIVRAGQQSVVRPGQAPSDPAPIPNSLLLKVQWPADALLNKRKILISGQSEPGALVQIGSKTIKVDETGRFSQQVPLAEGRNALEVHARTVGGLSGDDKRNVVVDTTPPRMGVDPNLWGNAPRPRP